MQAAGDLVAAAVAELAAGVQDGEHDLEGGLALLLHRVDGDAAAVVDDGDRVVGVDRHVDARAVAGQRLVDGVVDDLVDEVVQAAHAGRADVHARPLADGLEALEDGDVLGAVRALVVVLLGLSFGFAICLCLREKPRARLRLRAAGEWTSGLQKNSKARGLTDPRVTPKRPAKRPLLRSSMRRSAAQAFGEGP